MYFCFTDYDKTFYCVDHKKNCGKFLKRWKYQTTWPTSWEIFMQVTKQQLELDMEQQTGSKLGKGYVKAIYCHLAYLTYMQSTSCETLGWRKHSWNQECREKGLRPSNPGDLAGALREAAEYQRQCCIWVPLPGFKSSSAIYSPVLGLLLISWYLPSQPKKW